VYEVADWTDVAQGRD